MNAVNSEGVLILTMADGYIMLKFFKSGLTSPNTENK